MPGTTRMRSRCASVENVGAWHPRSRHADVGIKVNHRSSKPSQARSIRVVRSRFDEPP